MNIHVRKNYLKISKSKILKFLSLNMVSHTWKVVGFPWVAPEDSNLTMGGVQKGTYTFLNGRLLQNLRPFNKGTDHFEGVLYLKTVK